VEVKAGVDDGKGDVTGEEAVWGGEGGNGNDDGGGDGDGNDDDDDDNDRDDAAGAKAQSFRTHPTIYCAARSTIWM
jgi:hypothetical protein